MIDIVERLKFDATRCEIQFSKGVASNISEAADEIERLRAALKEMSDAYSGWLSAETEETIKTLNQTPQTIG